MGENSKCLRRLERGARAEAYPALPRKSARGVHVRACLGVGSARKLERSSGCRASLRRRARPRVRGAPRHRRAAAAAAIAAGALHIMTSKEAPTCPLRPFSPLPVTAVAAFDGAAYSQVVDRGVLRLKTLLDTSNLCGAQAGGAAPRGRSENMRESDKANKHPR